MKGKIEAEILDYFPATVKYDVDNNKEIIEKAQEIRIRIGQPICIRGSNFERFLTHVIDTEDILKILENFSNNSIYSVQNEINSGFITIRGGHRVGIVGTCVFEDKNIKNIKYISSLNIRIAREVKGSSDKIINRILDNSIFNNTLILSPPGCGKTTIVRDMISKLSNGTDFCAPYNVGLVDERSEIAAMYKGVPQNDVGRRTDVMNNCYKDVGMKMLIRSMNPQIIATDEIGGEKDEEAIFQAFYSGVKLLLTAHGDSLNDVSKRMLDAKIFKNIAVLKNEDKPGELAKMYVLEGDKYVNYF